MEANPAPITRCGARSWSAADANSGVVGDAPAYVEADPVVCPVVGTIRQVGVSGR